MKWLLGLNIAAALVYASFVASFLVADVWIFPELEVLAPPPPSVRAAIEQSDDGQGMREIALLLFQHITDQTAVVNDVVSSTIFWGRVHFLLALGIACINIVLLVRLRKGQKRSHG